MIDPDTSTFTTILQKLSSSYVPRLTVSWHPTLKVGDFLSDGGEKWIVERVRYKNPDDWFSEERVADCAQPWNKGSQHKATKVEWLEDRMFPRVFHA